MLMLLLLIGVYQRVYAGVLFIDLAGFGWEHPAESKRQGEQILHLTIQVTSSSPIGRENLLIVILTEG